ncbi:hypothetical protein BU23DRAFT_550806 [Bimuria novae-zelandiae CBS 107.79]|uniref:Uncharacterized protein n=1 Tax=Bimuria novae-zelandiae CBS 107.79 TaxID=1447943 RepID=A0A6A5VLY7_9PLEO|nr:hypothetical protein BU23DRAFT_550806 [Bimuria novae-zelandiae CBS 107.79]
MAALQLRRTTMHKDTAGNAERSPLRIEVAETVAVYVEQYGLPTPPPSPVPAERIISRSISTVLHQDLHARVLAQWATQHGRVLRLITMDWKDISHC